MRPLGISRQHMVATHELPMHGVGGFMSKDAKVVVRTGKAQAVEDAVGADKTLRETAALAMVARHDIHPAIRRSEQGCQFMSILRPERQERVANDLARLINRVTRRLTYFRAGSLFEMVRAQSLIPLIKFGLLPDLFQQVVDFCFGPVTIEIDLARRIRKMMQLSQARARAGETRKCESKQIALETSHLLALSQLIVEFSLPVVVRGRRAQQFLFF